MSDTSVTCHAMSRGYPHGEQRDVTVTPPLRASRVTLSPDPSNGSNDPAAWIRLTEHGEGHDGLPRWSSSGRSAFRIKERPAHFGRRWA
jgi:hypothetical protein